ncbi:MAG: D-glycerate dehydrogenase [Candidatus Glassbacteria bacterium RIFCSPLOWO2_12_FULL_58_11]|uniref:D-glycerate dehydrogenase n=1 Tax=Candidatus Glassbacteria bacterium RIFCSPLOWO2_12_FULL_58_11 TaxID=1817867 RepID=A0A1F5YZ15_9BACT|nr:MAG: D-glycerate dehydrogenase [Candidatus Glassbacteria bacterium RIFCSPLOWO2_12_FULL_58_11]
MREKVLVTRKLPGSMAEGLRSSFEVVLNPHDRNLTRGELFRMAEGCAGMISLLSDTLDREFIESHPRLKVIANCAVGYNNIDLHAAAERGIVVTNTPGVLTETTADLAWALILALGRRVVESDRYTREGRFGGWAPELFLGTDIYGKTLGIVGLGRIGAAVARRAAGFSMKLIYHSRSRKPELEKALGAGYRELDSLLAEADFISLHTPLDPGTRHLLDRRRISLMKPGSFLINTSRGPLVDEGALVEALASGKLAGAGLDVYENEPELHPGLAGLPNTVLLPHIGSASTETRVKMARMAAENLTAVLTGRTPPNPVPLPE